MAAKPLQHGLGLVELTTALAVVAILAAVAAPSLASFIELRRVDAAAGELAADVQFARGQAVARNRPLRLTVKSGAAGSCWIVHTGQAAQCSCTAPGPAACSGGAESIKTVWFDAGGAVGVQANVASMLFDPLHGTVTPAGTLRVAGAHGGSVQHTVNVMARTRSCSPAATVPGWRAC